MNEPEVIQDNVLQVRFQPATYPQMGVFKVMTERQVDEYFHDGTWTSKGASPTMVGSNTMSNNAFQILTHHWVKGDLEAWYVTVHPAF